MQGWTWRILIVMAVVTVLVYTVTRPDPETAGLYQSSSAQLVEMLGNSRDVVRRGAAAGLLSRGPESVPALIEAIPEASDDQFEQIFLVLEDLYVSADEATSDAAEDAIERLIVHDVRAIRHAAEQLLQANMSRRLLRACSKIQSFGAKFVISPLAVQRGADSQFPYDIVVIGPDWSGGDDGLKFFRGFHRQNRSMSVHIATDAPVSRAAILKLKEFTAVRRQSESCLGLLVRDPRDQSEPSGVRIRRLAPQSPAMLAGLQEDDVLLEMDDQTIGDTADYMMALKARPPGTVVRLKILRRNQEQDITITLGSDFGTGQCRCDGDPAEEVAESSLQLPEPDGPPIGPAGRGRFSPTTDHISPPAPGPARVPQRAFGDFPAAGDSP